jgi:hypothetical protein
MAGESHPSHLGLWKVERANRVRYWVRVSHGVIEALINDSWASVWAPSNSICRPIPIVGPSRTMRNGCGRKRLRKAIGCVLAAYLKVFLTCSSVLL